MKNQLIKGTHDRLKKIASGGFDNVRLVCGNAAAHLAQLDCERMKWHKKWADAVEENARLRKFNAELMKDVEHLTALSEK